MPHPNLISRAGLLCAGLCLARLFAVETAFAQRREVPTLPEYVIEIGSPEGCKFAPLKMTTAQPGNLQIVLSKPPPVAPRGEERPTVWTATISAQPAGEFWRVNVSVGLGEFYDAGTQPVAAYTLRTNERVEVREFMRHGVHPFRVGVVKVLGEQARAPRVTNRTQSVSVEKLETSILPEPYRLSLKNNFPKDVLAIQINSHKGSQFMALKWHDGGRLRPLIKAGELYQMEMWSEDRTCAEPNGYRPKQSDRVEVSAVVFADGSYEGTTGLAALMRAKALGHSQHLSRVLDLLNSWDGRDDLSVAEVTYYFRSLADRIEETAEQYMLNDLQSNFPDLGPETVPKLGSFLRHGQHEIETSLLGDAHELDSLAGRGETAQLVSTWLARTKTKYTLWLADTQAFVSR